MAEGNKPSAVTKLFDRVEGFQTREEVSMNRFNKYLAATFLSAVMFFAGAAQAMEIRQFDKMAGDDQIRYVDRLAQSVEDATKGELLARVKRFFMPKQPGEDISGMGRFEVNLSLARIADLEAVEKNPKARRLEVEDVMYVTLETSGIALPKSFRPVASNFQPKLPLSKKAMSKEEAGKALAEARAWAARTVDAPHAFRSNSGSVFSGFPDSQKAIAFFTALMAIGMAANNAGASSSSDSSGLYNDPHASDPWWQKSGYASYHDAVKAACIGAHPGSGRSYCN